MKTKVALIQGGYSKESEISFKSANCIHSTVDKEQFEVYQVLISEEGWYYIENDFITTNKNNNGACPIVKPIEIDFKIPVNKDNFSFQTSKGTIKPDVAYIMIHGSPGENGLLQGYFDMLKIPYTTCNAFVSALTFNKSATKNYLRNFDILTAKSKLFRKLQNVDIYELVDYLGLPIFVKPNNGGSSFGASKVNNKSEIIPAIEKAFAEDSEVIVEQFIKGTELTCGVLQNKQEKIVFPVTEIVTKNEFFDYEAKYKGLSEEITPARINSELSTLIQKKSLEIYEILGCSGVVRIDYLFDGNRLYFVEINTIPGMSELSIIPKQAACYGISMEELNTILIKNAIN